SADARTLSVQFAGTQKKQSFNLSANIELPDRLTEALKPIYQQGAASADLQYLEPSSGELVALHAERLSQASEPITTLRTTESRGRDRRQEVLRLDREGRLLHKEQPFFGATLAWDRCVNDCAAPIKQPYDIMSKLIVESPFRVPESAFA